MKRSLLITEQEKNHILNMHNTFKSNKYVIEEADEMFNPDMSAQVQASAVTAEKAKEELSNLGVDAPIESVVDPNDCGCVPKTGDSEKDGIIARIWDWANNPENRGSLRQTLSSLKDAIKKAKEMTPEVTTGSTETVSEQAGAAALITIGGVGIGASALIAIGVILLIIIVVALVSRGGKRRSSCKRRSKLFKRHGIDGMFM
jgi:hypothetical protein